MKRLIKPVLIMIVMVTITYFLPEKPIDPWQALGLRKIATLICAITFIQLLASEITKYLGQRKGSLLTGFLGGLASSTATVASVARASKSSINKASSEILIFIAATIAMQIVCLTIVLISEGNLHFSHLLLILSPIFAALIMIYLETRETSINDETSNNEKFEISHVIKLTVFIMATIIISKIAQSFLDVKATAAITFIVSLFEMHGSFVANLQLHENDLLSIKELGALFCISIVSSYISKLFLVYTLGSKALLKKVLKYTGLAFLSLGLAWIIFINIL